MKAYILFLFLLTSACGADRPTTSRTAKDDLNPKMTNAVNSFLKTLDATQKAEVMHPLTDTIRYDWHFIPRERLGFNLKRMSEPQRKAAMNMVEVVMSDNGYAKIKDIIDLENVLRVLESRPPNDTRRDPENYAFLVFGDPAAKAPWGWRMEGHHISIHYTSVNGHISFTPSFLGSNPGHVLIEVPQKGKRVLGEEEDMGYELLNSLNAEQKRQVVLAEKSPYEIFSVNQRQVTGIERGNFEGIAMKDMTSAQKELFKKLISIYLDRYHVTLKNQQMKQLEKAGMDNLYFAWMGDTKLEMGKDKGHYYRIHGPTILIEFDNTQNDANHIHTVVRDLTDDFSEDLLKEHYAKSHSGGK
ncbi:DUF3500 domain-containing protein [Persicitalea jodogahamensis]|uniref:DUF3500 domain-containing protein n=1 Tax=Persicitalea jodogahamensis TaxID=402147 RepID=A0A8J3D163_9BACT|nr:DUF3500 domain-containing protein [Persicitalea jodogahamensis]GHB61929.1 hypothetical protein GCM10007390_14790 [Persicitalea jodogahamensis]